MLHTYATHKGRIVSEMPEQAEGQVWVYEVLRMVQGIPLFGEAHLERLQHSAQLAGYQGFFPMEALSRGMRELADANGVYEGNVKLLLRWAQAAGDVEWAACFIPHRYPRAADYEHGVSIALMAAERSNPNAKVLNAPLRERVDALIQEKGVYEVLLLDHKGMITEGSRSNCFFVRDGHVITPPAQLVLPGITRSEVMKICRELSFKLSEQAVRAEELAWMDAVFITGTSPGVLPVSRIESLSFSADDPVVAAIRHAYDSKVQEYLQRRAPEKNQAGQ